MSDMDKEKVIEKRWEEFHEWLDTCPIEWTSRKGNSSSKVVRLPYKPRSERKGRL